MRNLSLLDAMRDVKREIAFAGTRGDETCGCFTVDGPRDRKLRILASSGGGWDHVSVSLPDRCPTWEEMEHVKRMFFRDDETAMQLHVPPNEHRSHHPFCLHLWRPHVADIPRPPAEFVAPPPGDSRE